MYCMMDHAHTLMHYFPYSGQLVFFYNMVYGVCREAGRHLSEVYFKQNSQLTPSQTLF